MEKKVLFLDFDGVLFDTLREVYLVNRYIFKNIDFFKDVNEKEYTKYSKYKFLVYNIWMFYYYNPLIFNDLEENLIIETFNSSILKRNIEKEEEYCKNFLEIRRDLILNHEDFWFTLEKPFQFFNEIKNIYEKNFKDIVIVSKKNKSSILRRFESYNFNLNSDKVFAREILDKYSSKGDFLEEYMKLNNYNKAIFVDDNMNNLNTVKSPNIKTILALWGNNAPDSKGLEQKEAIEEIRNFLS